MLPIEARRDALRARYSTWTPRTLDSWLATCAEQYGERPFVITDDRTIRYRETYDWSLRLAAGLTALGTRPGDRVGLLMANYLEFVPLKFAIARAGAVAIPFNYQYRRDELAYVLRQSNCELLITMTEFAGLDYLAMLDEIAPGWMDGSQTGLPALRRVVVMPTDDHIRAGVLTVDGLGALAEASASPEPGTSPDDVSDILYTSGTTGGPKGVQITHDAVLRTAYGSALTRGYEDGRRVLSSLPCYHVFGYVEGLLSVMMVGGAIIPQTSFEPERYFRGIERHGATDILCVSTMTVALLQSPARRAYDLSSCVALLSGAAPAPAWMWERVRDEFGFAEIVTGYGMTESGGSMTLTLPEDPLELAAVTVGGPKLAGAAGASGIDLLCEYKTIDPLTGADMPPGAEGELCSRGPTTMLGFYDKPEESKLAFDGEWLRSGDLGVVREDGYLQITGRTNELYKSGGELVMPLEIEALLTANPGISQAFVVGIPDERWGEIGCVFVVRSPGSKITADEVLNNCRGNLARFKVPKLVVFIDAAELPTTATGKVQKFRLAQLVTPRREVHAP